MSVSSAIRGPVEVTLSDGSEVTFRPIDMRTWAHFEEWLRGKYPDTFTSGIPIDALLEEAQTMSGMVKLLKLSSGDDDIDQKIGSVQDVAQVIGRLLDPPEGGPEGNATAPPSTGAN